MKRISSILLFIVCAALVFSCSKWTTPKALNYEYEGIEGSSHGEEYYANLKEYKASDHTIAFGWFSDWSAVGTSMSSKLMGMPDSMDVVSMWGNCFNLSEDKKEDLRNVQDIKGTKVMLCFIIDNVGIQVTPSEVSSDYTVNGKTYDTYAEAMEAYWGWYGDADDTDGMEKAIRKYADVILDSIAKYDYDGFDYDLEPNYGSPGNIASYPERIHIFLDEMSTQLGPKSGTGKLLCVDGQPYSILPEDGAELVDYFILQAYGDSRDSAIDTRMNTLFNAYDGVLTQEEIVSKTILTSNFESYASTGGTSSGSYTKRDGQSVPQITGYATYTYPGVDAKIGGFGAFRIGFDTNYQFIRQAISAANPPIK